MALSCAPRTCPASQRLVTGAHGDPVGRAGAQPGARRHIHMLPSPSWATSGALPMLRGLHLGWGGGLAPSPPLGRPHLSHRPEKMLGRDGVPRHVPSGLPQGVAARQLKLGLRGDMGLLCLSGRSLVKGPNHCLSPRSRPFSVWQSPQPVQLLSLAKGAETLRLVSTHLSCAPVPGR